MKLLFSCALLLLATGQAAASKKHHRQLTGGTCLGDISNGLVTGCGTTDCLTCANALSDNSGSSGSGSGSGSDDRRLGRSDNSGSDDSGSNDKVLEAKLIFNDDLSECVMGSTVKVDLKIELDNKSDNTLFDLGLWIATVDGAAETTGECTQVFFPDGGDTDAGQLPNVGEKECGDLENGMKTLKLKKVSVECKPNTDHKLDIDYCVSYKKPEVVVGTNMCDTCSANQGGTKPKKLTFEYTGVNSNANTQGDKGTSSVPIATGLSSVRIVTKEKNKVYFDDTVQKGNTFVVEDSDKLNSNIITEIFDENNKVIQTIQFHTSCSVPIVAGEEFGQIKLVSAVRNNDDGSSCGVSIDRRFLTEERCTSNDRAPGSKSQCACAKLKTDVVVNKHGPGGHGDPHIKKWDGEQFDYHGECDLVLAHSKQFGSGLGLDLHIRSTMNDNWTYISALALKIGDDVLEVASHGVYHLNGEKGADMPSTISGFPVSYTSKKGSSGYQHHYFDVDMGGNRHILIKEYKEWVSVSITGDQEKNLGDSLGLMGSFGEGAMLGRDGETVIGTKSSPNMFGQEWQVRDTDPMLFQTIRHPQYPVECTMPDPTTLAKSRFLRASKITVFEAEEACANSGPDMDACIFDVMATGDLDMADAGAF